MYHVQSGIVFLWEPDLRDVDPHMTGSIADGLCPDKVSDPLGGRAGGRERGLAMFSGGFSFSLPAPSRDT